MLKEMQKRKHENIAAKCLQLTFYFAQDSLAATIASTILAEKAELKAVNNAENTGFKN